MLRIVNPTRKVDTFEIMNEKRLLFGGRWLKVSLAALLLVCVASLAFLPYGIGHWLEHRLEQQDGWDVSIGDIDFNPFTGRFSMSHVHVRQQGREILALPEAELRFSWWPMLRHQLVIEEILVRKLDLDITLDDGHAWHLAGLPLALPAASPSASDWSIRVERISLGGTLRLHLPWYQGDVELGSLQLFGIDKFDGVNPVRTSLIVRLGKGTLDWRGSVDLSGEAPRIRGVFRAHLLPLDEIRSMLGPWLDASLRLAQGTLDGECSLDLALGPDGRPKWRAEALSLRNLAFSWPEHGLRRLRMKQASIGSLDHELRLERLEIRDASWEWQQDTQSVRGSMGVVRLDSLRREKKAWQLGAWQIGRLGLDGHAWRMSVDRLDGSKASLTENISIDEMQATGLSIRLHAKDERGQELQMAGLQIQGIERAASWRVKLIHGTKINWTDGMHQAVLPRAMLSKAELRELLLGDKGGRVAAFLAEGVQVGTAKKALRPLAAKMTALGIMWDGALSVDQVRIASANLHLRHLGRGDWRLGELPLRLPEGSSSLPPVHIAHVAIVDGLLDLDDRTIVPYYRQQFMLQKADIRDLDERHPLRYSPFVVQLLGRDGSRISLDGKLRPFARKSALILKARVSSFSLPPVSPFMIASVGYGARTGQLDADLTLTVLDEKLSGLAELTLRELDLTRRNPDRAEELEQSLSMSLESAMAMLRDDRGDIRLSIPISGELSNPRFNYQDAVNQALVTALQKAALGYVSQLFQPYGALITLADLAYRTGKKLYVIKLAPLAFPLGSAEPEPGKAEPYLAKVQELMKAKPVLRLTICGKAVPEDARRLRDMGLPADETALLNLANERGRWVRQALLERFGISADRLILCQAEMAASDGKGPRVELTLH